MGVTGDARLHTCNPDSTYYYRHLAQIILLSYLLIERVVLFNFDVLIASTMSWLTYATLCFIHALYAAYKFVLSYWRHFDDAPQPLTAPRNQLPTHLAMTLVPDEVNNLETCRDVMIENVEQIVSWCKDAGIARLTIYDQEGVYS